MQKLHKLEGISNAVKMRAENYGICRNYFNGTLHIAPDRTYHKLYHAGYAFSILRCAFISITFLVVLSW